MKSRNNRAYIERSKEINEIASRKAQDKQSIGVNEMSEIISFANDQMEVLQDIERMRKELCGGREGSRSVEFLLNELKSYTKLLGQYRAEETQDEIPIRATCDLPF